MNLKKIDIRKIDLRKILIKINPKIKSYIDNKKIDFTRDGLLDSLMIIRLITEYEGITKKKVKISKIDKKTFSNIDSIIKFLNK